MASNQKYLMAQSGIYAGPGDRSVYGVGPRSLNYWDCGFESRRGHGHLSLVSVVYCHVEAHVTRLSLVKRSPNE